jgi:M-phase inducer tyrosine phosphatase
MPARPKPHFGSLSGAASVRNGSPISTHGHVRRPSNPFIRPRKQYRRSLSMFENPMDMTRPRKESPPPCTLQAVVDVEEQPQVPALPHFIPNGNNDTIPRITRETMLGVLDGQYREQYDQVMIIDCRFEYEYDGGHIDGAVNYNDKELLASQLFNQPMTGRCLLVFHCEYSAHRAPIMARHVRAEDRNANVECYPKLTYPEVYILEGGYSGFFTEFRNRCYPQAYVEMDDTNHVKTCEREMGRLRQQRKGLSRAQTFAFGQCDRSVDDSPTAPARANGRGLGSRMLGRDIMQDIDIESPVASRNIIRNVREYDSPDMMAGGSPILGNDRGHTRRMVSF